MKSNSGGDQRNGVGGLVRKNNLQGGGSATGFRRGNESIETRERT